MNNLPTRTSIIAVLCLALAGCAPSGTLVSGRIVDDTVSIQAPDLPTPSPNLTVATEAAGTGDSAASASGGSAQGPASASGGSSPGAPAAASPVEALTQLGSVVVVESIEVTQGARVEAGDLIARLDSSTLEVNIDAAKADLAVAKAQVKVLDDALDTVAENRATVASTRSQVNGAISQLTSTRAQLVAKRAELRKLIKRIEALSAMPKPSLPATLPPGFKPPAPPAIPDVRELKRAAAQLDDGIAKIDAGLAQARSGLSRLSTASGDLVEARVQLRDLRALARIGVEMSRIGVRVATRELSLAEVRTPYAGVVVSALSAGDVVSPGATIATIRRDGPARVTTWVPTTLTSARETPPISVSADWAPGKVFSATVSQMGVRAQYPPTSLATEDVHLTRAIPVELTLDETADGAPAGAPVSVRIGN